MCFAIISLSQGQQMRQYFVVIWVYWWVEDYWWMYGTYLPKEITQKSHSEHGVTHFLVARQWCDSQSVRFASWIPYQFAQTEATLGPRSRRCNRRVGLKIQKIIEFFRSKSEFLCLPCLFSSSDQWQYGIHISYTRNFIWRDYAKPVMF